MWSFIQNPLQRKITISMSFKSLVRKNYETLALNYYKSIIAKLTLKTHCTISPKFTR